MAQLEILEVKQAEADPRLQGSYLDLPHAGDLMTGRALELFGWALGREIPVVAVEVLHAETVLRRIPLGVVERPDLTAAFPDVPEAGRAGFLSTVQVLGTAAVLTLDVHAVLADQQRVPLGTIQLQHRWRAGEDEQAGAALVSVVIPCYNQAHFLGEAIESVLAQTYPHLEVVVVDDGSTDNTEAVAARYPGVRCVRQDNQGLAAARNTGLRHSIGSLLVFLDADDRLLPQAVEVGLAQLQAHPQCAFTFGRRRLIDLDGIPQPISDPPIGDDHYITLLRRCYICMPAAALFRRAVFDAVGVFDSSVNASADYDLYLRIARQYPICSHEVVVAEYRRHGSNMSGNPAVMLSSAITVLRRQWPYVQGDAGRTAAYWEGLRLLRQSYGHLLVKALRQQVDQREWGPVLRGIGTLLRYHRRGIHAVLGDAEPSSTSDTHDDSEPFGNLRRLTPISLEFGYDRGQPIDRFYIEQFLARHADDIHGRVLEIGDDAYTTQFGGNRVEVTDVLHVDDSNPAATIVGDLATAEHIPSDTFDCIILTQTLHLIYDVPAAIRTLHRILKPGGVVLATFPGVSQIARDRWGETWYWGFTTLSARRLFAEVFPEAAVTVESRGNVLTAISFLHGLAAEELRQEELDHSDPTYQVLLMVRAVKAMKPS